MVNDMNYKQNLKKQSYIIAVSAILLAIVISGTSYALFFQVDTNSSNQVVETGNLSVTYGDNSQAITDTELVPMTDIEALGSSTLVSTIYVQNEGSLPANYSLTIENDKETFKKDGYSEAVDDFLNHDYIRVAVYKNGEMILEPTTLSDLTLSEENASIYELHSGSLDVSSTGNSTVTYAIKVWIASDAPVDIIGDFVYLKVNVISIVDEDKAATNA